MNNYFSILRDIGVERATGFFCESCLGGKPADEQSPDKRYCQCCYDFLLKEAKLIGTSKPCWIPRVFSEEIKPFLEGKNRPLKTILIGGYGHGIMSTLEDKNIEVDIFPSPTISRVLGKSGPKQKKLPKDFIKKLGIEGLGAKAIATKLKNDEGIEISYKTIQRILSGRRSKEVVKVC